MLFVDVRLTVLSKMCSNKGNEKPITPYLHWCPSEENTARSPFIEDATTNSTSRKSLLNIDFRIFDYLGCGFANGRKAVSAKTAHSGSFK